MAAVNHWGVHAGAPLSAKNGAGYVVCEATPQGELKVSAALASAVPTKITAPANTGGLLLVGAAGTRLTGWRVPSGAVVLYNGNNAANDVWDAAGSEQHASPLVFANGLYVRASGLTAVLIYLGLILPA